MAAGHNKRSRIPLLVWLLVPAALLVLAGANAHLVYVAYVSQPECVAHLKQTGTGEGQFRAVIHLELAAKLVLYQLECRAIDERLELSGIPLPLILNVADVDAVVKDAMQR